MGIKGKEGGYTGGIQILSTNNRGGLMILQPEGLSLIGKFDDKRKARSAKFSLDGNTYWKDKENQKYVFVSEIK